MMIRYLLVMLAMLMVLLGGGCQSPALPEAPEGITPPVCKWNGNFEFVSGEADYSDAMLLLGENAFCVDGALDGIIGECEGTLRFQAYTDRVYDVDEGDVTSWLMLQGRLSADDRFANDDPNNGTYSASHVECLWADGQRSVGVQLQKIPTVSLSKYDFSVVFDLDLDGNVAVGVFGDFALDEIPEWRLTPEELLGDSTLGEVVLEFWDVPVQYLDDPRSPE